MSSQNDLYSSKQARLDTVGGKDLDWWYYLQRAQLDYKATSGDKVNFQFWLAEHYGIQIYYDLDGILPNYDILDEQKYLLFKLKYA